VTPRTHSYVKLIQTVAVYQFAITVVSMHPVEILYALQWLLYVMLAAWLLSGYYQLATQLGRQHAIWHDLEVMALLYAGGLLVSLWTGPFYLWQVGWYERTVGNVTIASAVGFGDGSQGAGATMMMLAPFALFSTSRGFRKATESSLVLVGLFVTFSRGPLVGFIGGSLVVSTIGGLLFLAGWARIRRGHLMVVLTVLIVVVVFFAIALGSAVAEHGGTGGYANAVISMVAPTSGSVFMQDLGSRAAIWRYGLSKFAGTSSLELIFGHGFRSASEVNINTSYTVGATAWLSMHNSYIEWVFDFGIVGGLLMLLWCLLTTWRCLTGIGSRGQGWHRANVVASVGLVSFAILNMSETYFYGTELMVLMLVVAELPSLSQPCNSRRRETAAAQSIRVGESQLISLREDG
jgi:O-antigen ligase